MTLNARIARIRSDRLRGGLLAVTFLPTMARFAVGLAWNAPHRFFLPDPWRLGLWFYRAAAEGAFVGMAIKD